MGMEPKGGEKAMGIELREIISDAREEFAEWFAENPGDPYPEDQIHEIADTSVPVYTADLLQLGSDNWDLMLTEPEIGPAFDGTPTPVNIIAANVYETIGAALYEDLQTLRDSNES
jgi:hypothetical protein